MTGRDSFREVPSPDPVMFHVAESGTLLYCGKPLQVWGEHRTFGRVAIRVGNDAGVPKEYCCGESLFLAAVVHSIVQRALDRGMPVDDLPDATQRPIYKDPTCVRGIIAATGLYGMEGDVVADILLKAVAGQLRRGIPNAESA